MSACDVTVVNFEVLVELESDWSTADFVALLDKLEINGVAELPAAEAREICLLALADLDLEHAAAALPDYKLGSELTEGQVRNFGNGCQFERLWEQSKSGEFSEASSIVWAVQSTPGIDSVNIVVTSSVYWLDGLRETECLTFNGQSGSPLNAVTPAVPLPQLTILVNN